MTTQKMLCEDRSRLIESRLAWSLLHNPVNQTTVLSVWRKSKCPFRKSRHFCAAFSSCCMLFLHRMTAMERYQSLRRIRFQIPQPGTPVPRRLGWSHTSTYHKRQLLENTMFCCNLPAYQAWWHRGCLTSTGSSAHSVIRFGSVSHQPLQPVNSAHC